MRWIQGILIVLLTACGGAAQASPFAEPTMDSSVPAEASIGTSPQAPVPSGPLAARPVGSVEGAPLGYLEYLPPDYADGEPRPLLLFLHGAGEAGDGSDAALELVDKLGIPQMIAAGDWPDDHPFVVLSPQYGTEHAESDCGMADDVAAFLDFATQHYEVDPSRVYLTGISCGAIGIWDYLAARGNEVVAAAVPIAGHAEWALEEAGCVQLAEVPVWAFHGAKDETVPLVHVEEPMEQVRACEGAAESAETNLTVYPDADHFDNDAWTRTYDLSAGNDIYTWMLEHTNESPVEE